MTDDTTSRAMPGAGRPDPRSAGAVVERYGPGEAAKVMRPGDFILTHRRGRLMPALITLAQRRRFRGDARQFAHWSHAALITTTEGGLVEEEGRGVQRSPIAKYHQDEYHLVRMDAYLNDQQRAAAVQLAESLVGEGFGYLVMLSLAIWLLTGIPLRWARRGHEICSGLVAEALVAAGQHFTRPPAFMLPADLAEAYGARVSQD